MQMPMKRLPRYRKQEEIFETGMSLALLTTRTKLHVSQ